MPQCDNEVWECECSYSLIKNKKTKLNQIKWNQTKTNSNKKPQKQQQKPPIKQNPTLSAVTSFPISHVNMSS